MITTLEQEADLSQRILSISGLRGVIGDGLDPSFLVEFSAAVGTLAQGGPIIVSRDGRSSGNMVKQAILAGLMATGCQVVDADIASTPTAGVLVHHLGASGGIQITASHNPIQWNGLKPFSAEGRVYDQETGERLLRILNDRAFSWEPWDRLGSVRIESDPHAPHLERVLKLVDVEKIRSRRFKVVLDCNHGSGAILGPRLLRELGCDIQVLGGTPDGHFEHVPEPLQENLGGLCEAVRLHQADVGFAQDPDADRLAIVDNLGNYIGEELTLALCADYLLPLRSGPIVVNGSTSRVTADLARKYGCLFHRSWVGEAHVVTMMKEVGAVLGGEGNGGVIDPNVGFVRDSFVSMAHILAGLESRHTSLAEWVSELPRYSIVKDKLICPRERVARACSALRERFSDAAVQEGDGLRLDWADSWVQVRASNTEPILRVIAESPEESNARKLCRESIEIVRSSVT